MHQSIATIDSPEFINLQPLDINPLMSSCEIKVLYLGENRNHSYISKEVATDMAKSLRGAPIVGYYRDEIQDFGDHGERVIFENGDVKFECMTVPYGFVAPDAKVWFQKFDDLDDFGNSIPREYLMTTGFLWTGQFEEAKLAAEGDGRPNSMELDENTLDGKWSTNVKTSMDFFIINDAIFSKLCILGEDVEPCFEGSSVSAPKVSTSFTKVDDDFKKTLFTMMQELRFALEGGQNMEDLENVVKTPVVDENSVISQDNSDEVKSAEIKETTEGTTSNETVVEKPATVEPAVEDAATETDFACKKKNYEDDKKEDEKSDNSEDSKDNKEEDKKDSKDDEDEKKYSLLEEKYNELESKFTALTEECEALRQFKVGVEDAQKDELINSFYMLDDSEKQEIKDNKSKFSLEDIEAKLSILYTRKNIKLDLNQLAQEAENQVEKNVTTYSLADNMSGLPDWVKAVHEVEEKNEFLMK